VTFQTNFLDWSGRFATTQFAIPTIFLFIALLAVPQAHRPSPRRPIEAPSAAQVRESGETAIGMVVVLASCG
jgi:hypothetical protein